MYYTPEIYDPKEGIDIILSAAQKFNADRFLYALEFKNWDEKTIERMGEEVGDNIIKLEKEYKRLSEFAKDFNKEFVTTNNQCFNSALTMLRKLKSGISGTKKIFMKFCPRAHKERIFHAIRNKPVSAYSYAYISADQYSQDMFKFEGYPACISGLYNEMEKFFMLLVRCLQLCKQVLKDEEQARKKSDYCNYLFKEFKEKVLKEIHDVLMMIPRDSEYLSETNNPAIASRSNYDNDEAWAPQGFHNFSKKEVKHLVIKQVFDDEAGSDLTRTEIMLFGNDVARVHKFRHIITHFDELLPANYNRKNLPAERIQMFFQYVSIPSGMEQDAVRYFNKVYNASAIRSHQTVSYQAVNSYKKKVLENADGSYDEFVKLLIKRFYSTNQLQIV